MAARRVLASPTRNLLGGVLFVFVVAELAIAGYVSQGWSLGDAAYMAVITVFTVGYDEVHPINTVPLRAITMGLIGFGCTGMIFLTGTLVQIITAAQIDEVLGNRRMNARIDKLHGHVIVCGFGRIGNMLARELHAAGTPFVVLERSEARAAEAQGLGYAILRADATEEESLTRVGVARARALATVLPDDAANVFITLSARSLNRTLTIIARGEAPSTERKLLQAGADRVVLPAHIGAERVAEILLYPGSAETLRQTTGLDQQLRALGLSLEVVVAEAGSAWAHQSVAAIEAHAKGAFLVVAIERPGEARMAQPDAQTLVLPGDGVTIIGRNGRAPLEGFGET